MDGKVVSLVRGRAVDIPQGAPIAWKTRLFVDLVIIEVQTGTYFGEDDIERLEDRIRGGHKRLPSGPAPADWRGRNDKTLEAAAGRRREKPPPLQGSRERDGGNGKEPRRKD